MDERATGVILRTRRLTETSLIVNWLTPDAGRLATVAKGALRPKSAYRGKLDLYFIGDFSFQRSRRTELHQLREFELKESFPELRRSLGSLAQVAYAASLLEQSTETETPLASAFALFTGMLRCVAANGPNPAIVFAFELKWLVELGLSPDVATAKLSAGTRQILERLLAADWALIARLKLADAQAREISQFLHGFIIYHLERIPHGRREAIDAI